MTWIAAIVSLGKRSRLLAVNVWGLLLEHRRGLVILLLLAIKDAAATELRSSVVLLTFIPASLVSIWKLAVTHSKSKITEKINLLLRARWVHFDSVEFMLTHDGFTNINSVHIASIADISETKINIVALKADPVSNSLHFLLFRSLILLTLNLLLWLIFLLILNFTAILKIFINSGHFAQCGQFLTRSNRTSFVKNLILALNTDFFECSFYWSHFVLLRLLLSLTTVDRNNWLDLAKAKVRRSLTFLSTIRCCKLLLLLLFLFNIANQMLGLAVHVIHWLSFVAPIAFHTALEVVILALTANPATVREIKILLLRLRVRPLHAIIAKIERADRNWVTLTALVAAELRIRTSGLFLVDLALLGLLFFFLVLAPLRAASVVLLFVRGGPSRRRRFLWLLSRSNRRSASFRRLRIRYSRGGIFITFLVAALARRFCQV